MRRGGVSRFPLTGAGLLLTGIVCLGGCGYRLAGSGSSAGAGQTLAVPLFLNQSDEFRIEQRLTEAVRQEMVRRTRYRVVPASTGDVVIEGSVLSVSTAPIIFTDLGRAIAYTMTVDIGVRVTDTTDGAVLVENPRLSFRESFELSNDSSEFVPEDTAAIDRLAGQFAAYLTTTLTRTIP